jgi:hypothetical protein
MLRLFGEAIAPKDAANLAVALLADGGEDATSAARAIESAMPVTAEIRLTERQRAAVRRVLKSPPAALVELSARLILEP